MTDSVLNIYDEITSQEIYSLSSELSYGQTPSSLEAMRLDVIMILSLWNLTAISNTGAIEGD